MITRLKSDYIVALLEDIKRSDAVFREGIKRVQKVCGHPEIAEDEGQPPHRICLYCGLSEVGWGCGFLVLKDDHPRKIDTALLRKLACGFTVRESHKGPLLRDEKTIQDLIGGEN